MFLGFVSGGGGRPAGSTNKATWFILVDRVKHGRYPSGTSKRMVLYYDNHIKMGAAIKVVRLEKRGTKVDHRQYFKNSKERASSGATPKRNTGKGSRPPGSKGRKPVDIRSRRKAL